MKTVWIALLCAALTPARAGAQAVLYSGNGHYYEAVDVPGGMPWTAARSAAESMSFMGVQGHLATMADAEENTWVYSTLAGMPLDRYWIGGFQDMTLPSYSEPDGGWAWVDGSPWVFEAWFPGEPNDFGGTEHYIAYDHLSFRWNDIHDAWSLNAGYVVEYDVAPGVAYCFGDGSGTTCPCGNAGGPDEGCANSSGAGARLTATGSSSVAADDLAFQALSLLPNQPALLFAGLNAVNGGAGTLFGDGLRCAGGSVVRLGVQFPDGAGDASWGPGLAASGGWTAGDIRRFQAWFRDPGTGSPCGFGFNLSNGFEVGFGP